VAGAHAFTQLSGSQDLGLFSEAEDPGLDLGADPDAQSELELARADMEALGLMPAVRPCVGQPSRVQPKDERLDRPAKEHPEGVAKDALRVILGPARILEGLVEHVDRGDAREAVRVKDDGGGRRPPARGASRSTDHVELVVVDHDRQGLDAERLDLPAEARVLDRDDAMVKDSFDDLVEERGAVEERRLASAAEEPELAVDVLEHGAPPGSADGVGERVADPGLVARALEQRPQTRPEARRDGRGVSRSGREGREIHAEEAPSPFVVLAYEGEGLGRVLHQAVGHRRPHAEPLRQRVPVVRPPPEEVGDEQEVTADARRSARLGAHAPEDGMIRRGSQGSNGRDAARAAWKAPL